MPERRILVIDDEPGVREILNIHLRGAGYRVTSAETATEGLRLVASTDFDLAICDFTLPDIPGAELIDAVRKARPGLPMMIISGFIDDDTEEAFRRRGVLECLKKPFSKETLLTAIEGLFSAGTE